MGDARRSLIVMLPADLVDRIDARVAEAASRGEACTRDDLLGEAVERWLREARGAAPAPRPRGMSAVAVDALSRRVGEDIERLVARAREASALRGRAIDELSSQLRQAAETGDRSGFVALGDRLASVQARLRGGVDEALAGLGALVGQASGLLASSQPTLPADARSRWLSAQAGRGLAPDLVVRAADAIDAALRTQALVRAAAADAVGVVDKSRATLELHIAPHDVGPADLRLDADLDLETWGYAAQVAAADVATSLATQRAVIDVALDHAIAVGRTSLDVLGGHVRALAEILAEIPDVASAG